MTSAEFFKQFGPIRTCMAMPLNGGDWSCLLWTATGKSWWIGDPIPETLTKGFIVRMPNPPNGNLE